MLKINKLTDYAIVILSELATTGARQSAADLSRALNLNLPTVSKLLKQLNEAGLVNSARGTQGGYELSRPAAQITVAEIITTIEGAPALTNCVMDEENCSITHSCKLKANWQLINRAVISVLSQLTLADMQKEIEHESES